MSKNETIDKLKEFKESQKRITLLSAYDLEIISGYVSGLFSFAAFNIGDEIEMKTTFEVSPKTSWGWMYIRHLLKKGSKAIIEDVDWYEGCFRYTIVFKDTTFINDKNEIHNNYDNKKNRITISERWLSKSKRKAKKCTS